MSWQLFAYIHFVSREILSLCPSLRAQWKGEVNKTSIATITEKEQTRAKANSSWLNKYEFQVMVINNRLELWMLIK